MTNPVIVPVKLPVSFKSYPAQCAPFAPDKSGAMYQVVIGDLNKTAPWGLYVFRTPKGGKQEQLFFVPGANGDLYVYNKKLYVAYCDSNWQQWTAEIPGYIPFPDQPSGTVVNINESAMAVYKQQVSLAQTTANNASASAQSANASISEMRTQIRTMQNQITSLQNQITALQSQLLTRAQIEDIVWTKIWDVNYLIRIGFLQGSSPLQQVQDYLNDLTVFIKRVVGK